MLNALHEPGGIKALKTLAHVCGCEKQYGEAEELWIQCLDIYKRPGVVKTRTLETLPTVERPRHRGSMAQLMKR